MKECAVLRFKKGALILGANRSASVAEKKEEMDISEDFFCVVFREMMTPDRCKKLQRNDPTCFWCNNYEGLDIYSSVVGP